MRKKQTPMSKLVRDLRTVCDDWLEIDALSSPPCTASMLHASDRDLAAAVKALLTAYPKQMGRAALREGERT